MSESSSAHRNAPSGSQREFGSLRYVRPGTEVPVRCPAGHRLGVRGPNGGYSHLTRSLGYACDLCLELGSTRWSWTLVDAAEQCTQAGVPTTGLALVKIPPPRRGGSGRVQLVLAGSFPESGVLGEVVLALCEIERRAVLQHVEVPERWRRHGVGRVLVAAAAVLGSGYAWSTRPLPRSAPVAARAFWSRVGPADWPAPPAYCSHMLAAARREQ